MACAALGLVDLTHPNAERANLTERDIDIVIPVHVLTHPRFGAFIVDTGVTETPQLHGAAAIYFGGMDVVAPLAQIIAAQPEPLAGVLLTHTHIDHVLGLPDVPSGTPIYIGPGELETEAFYNPLMASTYDALFGHHTPFKTWDFGASPLAPFSSVIDVFGDSSLFAIHTPGHTPGSTAYVAITTTGPKLFVGDNAHLWWGWNNGVTPGSYSADHEENADSLAKLKSLSDAHPELEVFVGHEMNGMGTGVDPYRVQY